MEHDNPHGYIRFRRGKGGGVILRGRTCALEGCRHSRNTHAAAGFTHMFRMQPNLDKPHRCPECYRIPDVVRDVVTSAIKPGTLIACDACAIQWAWPVTIPGKCIHCEGKNSHGPDCDHQGVYVFPAETKFSDLPPGLMLRVTHP